MLAGPRENEDAQADSRLRLEAALAVVGGKWKPIVLWRLAVGPGGWERRRLVEGISEKMLIQQLREMEADEIGRAHV